MGETPSLTPPDVRPLRDARLILASASPRRSMLLATLGLTFVVDPPQAEETIAPDLSPGDLVKGLSRQKAAEIAPRHPEADLILAADTIVVRDGAVLGKPVNRVDAARMLGALAGQWHQVFTGYTVIAPGLHREVCAHTVSEVRIRPMSATEIDAYIDTGEPMDKAGSYAIQGIGSLLVAEIRGCYTNIVGLPLPCVAAACQELGWHIW